MLIIGLTGGIGSGKTTVAHYFEALAVPVIDADRVGRELVAPGQEALQAIISRFGPEIVTANGELDRARLRDIVFADPAQRHTLESILHPRIRAEILRRVQALEAPYCIVSVPLLVESHWTDLVDRVLVVDTSRENQLQRTQARDGLPLTQVEAILASQADRDSRLQAADDVIRNDADTTSLQQQVNELHQRYLQLAASAH